MNNYEVPGAGGSWEHRGGDCLEHGSNVPFAKPYGSSEKLQCVKCMLECSAEIAKLEAKVRSRWHERSEHTRSDIGFGAFSTAK